MTVQVFERVGYDTVLPERHDYVVRGEQVSRQKATIEELNARAGGEGGLHDPTSRQIFLVFRHIVREVRTEVLDIESRLFERMKSRRELLDPTMARDEHDLAITWHETPLR